MWDDFHHDLLLEIKGALAPLLPAGYVVRGSERTYPVMTPAEGQTREYRFWSDVSVAATGRGTVATTIASPAVPATPPAVNAEANPGPISIPAMMETEYREIFLEIRRPPPAKKLVTCIEVLSPSNKRPRSKGWRLFNRKRRAYLAGQAHFVEIDLLRGGRRMPMAGTWPDSPYYLMVCRTNEAPVCKVWPAFFTRPITPIPIPLLSPDADVSLEIQPLIERIYARSHYEVDIDYTQPLQPPFDAADAAWLQERVHFHKERI